MCKPEVILTLQWEHSEHFPTERKFLVDLVFTQHVQYPSNLPVKGQKLAEVSFKDDNIMKNYMNRF